MEITCFKAYDIRGRLPDELNEEIAYRIGRAYAQFLQPKKVVVGRDVRLSSASLAAQVAQGLCDSGVDVYDIGLCGTEEVYFATFHEEMDGGIMVTASHNPMDYNGLKLVRHQSRPISADNGLETIRTLAQDGKFQEGVQSGQVYNLDVRAAYIDHLLGYVDADELSPLKIVVNGGNGCAGPVLDVLRSRLPVEMVTVNHQPDGNFPNGIPNPLLPGNRAATAEAVIAHGAAAGVAWDGDFDRCFLFDETGSFIDGYYIVGLLAEAFLCKNSGAKIVHDPRLVWNTLDIVQRGGGETVVSKSGHSFIKEKMRNVDAVYGGEMSAHHYFRQFSYCDSGMIPWLLVLELMSRSGKKLSELVGERISLYPSSGEINRSLNAAEQAMAALQQEYGASAVAVDHLDGLSMEFANWRFNLRSSNTEPVVRLNVESRGDIALMKSKTAQLLSWLESWQEKSLV